MADVDRELIAARSRAGSARADLARQLHVSPETELKTLDEVVIGNVPDRIEGLYRLATTAKPELRGRLAAVARDQKAIALVQALSSQRHVGGRIQPDGKDQRSNSSHGLGQTERRLFRRVDVADLLQKDGRRRSRGAGSSARRRNVVRVGARRDLSRNQGRDDPGAAQGDTLALFQEIILPKSEQALKSAATDYQNGNVDYVTLITAFREVLQVRLLIAQTETELGKALASLERAVGVHFDERRVEPKRVEGTPERVEIEPEANDVDEK